MSDQVKPIVRAALLFLSALLVVWILMPAYRTYTAGFMLGMVISLVNGWMLLLKIEALSRTEQTGRRVNLGTLSRMCMAIIGVMIALKLPHHFNLVFTIIGMFFVQVVTLFMGFMLNKRNP
ncbi:ATP synthase subunit I [Paenibacillus xerothermodurans]|uniref:ATP synthase subunit I n=1 Tax=Paenibacillus xerothermodurans TaxID=1977292 RepID=A0A2W1NNS6_PAEXE|nr:ATP synthase subunit I [Paenibacillus xerothermodurans]PZE19406.1 hypothetical protein CBW46_018750 [Paenibacillus xerothermodurans]